MGIHMTYELCKLGFIIVHCKLCLFQTFLPLPFCSNYSALLLFLLHRDIHIYMWCLVLTYLCFHPYFLLLFRFNLIQLLSSHHLPYLHYIYVLLSTFRPFFLLVLWLTLLRWRWKHQIPGKHLQNYSVTPQKTTLFPNVATNYICKINTLSSLHCHLNLFSIFVE